MSTVDESTLTEEASAELRDKILHVLKIFPRVSFTMMQVGIGPRISPRDWHPVLHKLVDEDLLFVSNEVHETPSGRQQTYRVICLANEPLN